MDDFMRRNKLDQIESRRHRLHATRVRKAVEDKCKTWVVMLHFKDPKGGSTDIKKSGDFYVPMTTMLDGGFAKFARKLCENTNAYAIDFIEEIIPSEYYDNLS